ncbi:MAG: cation transporter [Bacteroidetes bacterium]|nr:MAG: cation transporter [Bacteroidota bacterium]
MNSKKKIKAARISIYSNTSLIIMKVAAGLVSGSVSIISEAIHSGLDLLASFIAYLAVRISDKPADKEHPFGHGKYENVSGVVEALLIFAAAVWIVYEAVYKLLEGEHIIEGNGLIWGIIVMFISGLVNLIVSRYLYKVARETDSVALEADALHLKTDIYTSWGVSIGLTLIYFTGFYWMDPFIAIFVALFIVYEAYEMLLKAFNPLLDSAISDEEIQKITNAIEDNLLCTYNYSGLKTRKSGPINHIQFVLSTIGETHLNDACVARNILRQKIIDTIPNSEVTVVLESAKFEPSTPI